MTGPLHQKTILVAEDERNVRMLLRVVLEAAGARVLEAEDGRRALALLDQHPEVALLLTDLWMPELDGHALASAVHERRPGIPIVLLSAMDPADHVPELLALVDQALRKPFRPSELVATLERLVRRRVPDHEAVAHQASRRAHLASTTRA